MIDLTRAYGLTFAIPANDIGISQHLRNSGEFAKVESDLIIDYMAAAGGGTYIDVGGNVGSIALPVAAASADNYVIAIEAQRFLATLLAANAVSNNLANLSVIHAAAGATPGLMRFPQVPQVDDRGQWNYGVVGIGVAGTDTLPAENVRVCSLDEIAPSDTRFVKVDVEGYEYEVLRGARHLVSTIRPCWLIETSAKTAETAYECMRMLRNNHYNLFWFFAPLVTPSAAKASRSAPSVKGDLNCLAVPAEIDRNPWHLDVALGDTPDLTPTLSNSEYLRRYGFRW